ncbi:hypothetical protein J7E93_07735 [Streptomyces sp. ISL-36]|uniref:hypothetical protein n=1 Tax=Streptomyces sp. ISL-36 TaxID=2819182 RepID=UPI001BE831BB|nr:hypothetical protein [Streptomyces sp. ISL-36]MBT2440012.1 hypothetical protein [Streptomyces sp. ISL-36]
MIRHTVRALCAASLVIAPLALSTPAHAATACTVNGMPRPDGDVNGTPGDDYIRCSSVDPEDTVDGLGGADTFVLTGPVGGTVAGGLGRDYFEVTSSGSVSGVLGGGPDADYFALTGPVTAGGQVYGDTGNDYFRVAANGGFIDAGPGTDVCRVTGNPPVNCEF